MSDYWMKRPVYKVVDYQGDITAVEAWLASLDDGVLLDQYGASNFRVEQTQYGPQIVWDGISFEHAGRHTLRMGQAVGMEIYPYTPSDPVILYLVPVAFSAFEPVV